MKRVVLFLLVAAQVPLFSQVGYPGGYPPGQGPGQSPGQGGPGLPWPHRGKKNGAESKDVPTQRSTGKLTKLDEQSIVVEVPDGRVLEYKRAATTKFLRDKQEIKPAEVKPGNRVTVEATEDAEGYLHAVSISLEPDSPPEANPEASPEASKASPEEGGGRASGNIPAPQDAGPGPPRLKRGVPAHRQDEDLEDARSNPSSPTEAAESSDAVPAVDPVIEKARQTTVAFTEKLPNYVCKEFMARYASAARPADWRALDVVSTSLVYEQGRESYREITINGKPFQKGMEQMTGAWSTGEFATMLLDLFNPWTAAEFHQHRQASLAGVEAQVYDFVVERARSHWRVTEASQSIMPSYKGSVWIEPATGRVLRIEMQARALPKEFPLDTVESAIDYDNAMIGGKKFLLPVHAETLACQRGTNNCSRNAIDFRNYHKFEATSDVTFSEK